MHYSMDLIMKSYDKKKQKRPYTILVSKKTHDQKDQQLVDLAGRVGIDKVLFEPIELSNFNSILRS